jgi:hypothetical protein
MYSKNIFMAGFSVNDFIYCRNILELLFITSRIITLFIARFSATCTLQKEPGIALFIELS